MSTILAVNPTQDITIAAEDTLRRLGVLFPEDRSRLQREHEAMPFCIDPFIPRRGVGIIVGDSGIGKTPFNFQKTVAAATGTSFLGKPSIPSRVLYFDLEPGPVDFLDEFAKSIGQPIPRDMFLPVKALDKPEDARHIIAAARPAIVEIDTLRQFQPSMSKDNDTAAKAMKMARNWVNEFGIFVNFVHHPRKRDPKYPPPSLRNASVNDWFQQAEGARALYNHTDLRVAVEKGDTEGVDLLIKYNYRNMGDSPLIALRRDYSEETGNPCGYSLAPVSEVLSKERLAFYNQLPANVDLTPKSMRHTGSGSVSRETVHKAISDFLVYGMIKKIEKGVYRKCSL
jgi:hypothetical protein